MRFPFPLEPNAYHEPSGTWMKAGSGKSASIASRDWLRFSNGDARTTGTKANASANVEEKRRGHIPID